MTEILKYGIIGVINLFLYYGIYWAMCFITSYPIPLLVSFIITNANGYYWNKNWTYKMRGFNFWELMRYYAAYLVSFVFQQGLLAVFIYYAGLSEQLAGIPTAIIGAGVSFIGQRTFAFKVSRGNKQ